MHLRRKRREDAIRNQVKIRDDWRWYYRLWTTLHYLIGITALFASTLVAAKPDWIGQFASMLAWLVAFLTALLTFLTPDKRAKQYIEAWTLLSSEIDRYNSDESRTLNDVLKAYHQGDAIVRETRGGQQYQSI